MYQYQVPRDTAQVTKKQDLSHAGLALTKFIKWDGKTPPKKDKLTEYYKKISGISGLPTLVVNLKERQEHLAQSFREAGYYVFQYLGKALSPIAIGLGENSVLETGITLHPLFGIPYLPATAIRGLARGQLYREYLFRHQLKDKKENLVAFDNDPKTVQLFGGSTDKYSSVGPVTVLDAVLLFNQSISLDIMTPHYSKYYDPNNKTHYPSNTESPVPILFPVIPKGTKFQFVFLAPPRKKTPSGMTPLAPEDALKEVIRLLKAGLEKLGIGAKTSAGYGRFTFEEYLATRTERESLIAPSQTGPGFDPSRPIWKDEHDKIRTEFLNEDGSLKDAEACMAILRTLFRERGEKKKNKALKLLYVKIEKYYSADRGKS